MRDYHGIIFAYHDEPALRDLTANRTAASLPFCLYGINVTFSTSRK